MGQNDESTYFIDVYFDNKEKKNYILNANSVDVKSYTFKNGELYHKYKGSSRMTKLVQKSTQETKVYSQSKKNS